MSSGTCRLGTCLLDAGHHGPCHLPGCAKVFRDVHKDCRECDIIDAREVLRLDAGGALERPQKEPRWMRCPSWRRNVVTWANKILGGEPAPFPEVIWPPVVTEDAS